MSPGPGSVSAIPDQRNFNRQFSGDFLAQQLRVLVIDGRGGHRDPIRTVGKLRESYVIELDSHANRLSLSHLSRPSLPPIIMLVAIGASLRCRLLVFLAGVAQDQLGIGRQSLQHAGYPQIGGQQEYP
jgi:hypothetical protein